MSLKLSPTDDHNDLNVTQTLPIHVTDVFDDSDSEEIPDPFSDDEDENDETLDRLFCTMVTSDRSLVIEDEEMENELEEQDDENEPGFTPIFVPSLSYLAQVPASMQPELFASEKEQIELQRPSRERIDEDAMDGVDDNVRELINRLSSSTSRGAFLANRLSDIHRRIATGSSLTDHNDWFDDEETETDIDLKDTEDTDELTVPSPELCNEIETEEFLNCDLLLTSTPLDDEEAEFEESRPASTDSMVLAIDEAINILDPIAMGQMPLAPSQPTNSLFPAIGNQGAPSFIENLDESYDEGNNDEAFASEQPPQSSDSSTEVTRFLIKHLPKQLTQLRNEKHELEDKIHDFEQVVSEQRMQMSEHERRVEVERSKTKKLEERLIQVN